MRLDRAKLAATLTQRNPLGCPWCGAETWAPAEEPTMFIRAGELQQPGPIMHINVFPVLCTSCGFVVLFDAQFYALREGD